MSIASREALKRWPEIDTSCGGVISQSYAERYAMRRSGFVEGAQWQEERYRTTEPTDTEIRAAAIEMYHFEIPSHSEAITREQAAKDFAVMWPSLRDRFVGEARAALLAARKAAMA